MTTFYTYPEPTPIYFTKNDAGLGVRNGSLATIERIKGQTVVARLDGEEGRRVMFGVAHYSAIDHGYAATIHKSQGVTVDRAHLLASRNLDRHSSYVAMSRHRDRLDVHWSKDSFPSFDRVERAMSREAIKDTSLAYGDEATAPAGRFDGPRQRPRERRQTFSQHAAPAPSRRDDRATLQENEQAARERQRQDARGRTLDRAGSGDHDDPALTPAEMKDRATVTRTAEIIAFDQETADLAAAMKDRHAIDIEAERSARFDLMKDSAIDWQEAMLEPVLRKARHADGRRQMFDEPEQTQERPSVSRRFEL